MKKYITIITPTYNRGNRLQILLDSLNKQTSKNFSWILIDDGSTDDTQEIVSKWEIQNFSFCYIKQNNGGKHRAINNAISYVETEFVFIVDSDDYLLENAISNIELWIKTIEKKTNIAAVSGLRIYPDGKKMSGFPKKDRENNYIIASNIERWKIGLTGDQAEVYRTDLLKRYPFPEFAGENFISEGAVWNKIAADGYKIKWYNTPIYVCEYLEDGLTKNLDGILVNNFQGYTYYAKLCISNYKGFHRLKAIVKYIKISKTKGLGVKDCYKNLEISFGSIVVSYIVFLIHIVLEKIKSVF